MEEWRDIKGFEGLYQISNHGRLKKLSETHHNTKRVSEEKILSPSTSIYGYKTTNLSDGTGYRKQCKVHRLVGYAFVHNPFPDEYKIINHIDGVKTNNHHTNLEWCTAQMNVTHAIQNKLRKHSTFQLLTEEEVREIREIYNDTFLTIDDISEMYNVSNLVVNDCILYKRYKNLDPEKKDSYDVFKTDLTLRTRPKVKRIKIPKPKPITLLTDIQKKDMVYNYVNGFKNKKELFNEYNLTTKDIIEYIETIDITKINVLYNAGEVFREYTDNLMVSNQGRVFNGTLKRITNYNSINGTAIYRVVAKIFLINPMGYKIIKFIDGDINNQKLSNLYWSEHSDRITLETTHGKELLETIRTEYVESSIKIKELAEKYYLGENTIRAILKGHYKPKQLIMRNDKQIYEQPKPTEDECMEILRLYFEELWNYADIHKKYSEMSSKDITDIIHKERDTGREQSNLCGICGGREPENFTKGNKTKCKTCKSKISKEKYRKKNGIPLKYKKEFLKEAFEAARKTEDSFEKWFEKNS